MIAAEYGYTLAEFKKLTMREISEIIDAIMERRSGYKTVKAPEANPQSLDRVQRVAAMQAAKRMKGN